MVNSVTSLIVASWDDPIRISAESNSGLQVYTEESFTVCVLCYGVLGCGLFISLV